MNPTPRLEDVASPPVGSDAVFKVLRPRNWLLLSTIPLRNKLSVCWTKGFFAAGEVLLLTPKPGFNLVSLADFCLLITSSNEPLLFFASVFSSGAFAVDETVPCSKSLNKTGRLSISAAIALFSSDREESADFCKTTGFFCL